MADILFSTYSQAEIEQALYKINGIEKNLTEINLALENALKVKYDLEKLRDGEILKNNAGELVGTGIIETTDKIFFPKDGRFPSGSIDVGPGATVSENGGWLQYKAQTLGRDYILLDYELTQGGTTKPVYWERGMEEQGAVIQPVNSVVMNVTRIEIVPSTNHQINKLMLDFVEPVENLVIEVKSLDTNKVIKYLPNENAYKSGTGGFDFATGINNIIDGYTSTPLSVLTAYNLEINFSKPVKLRGNGVLPWFSVDRQLITKINMLVEGDKVGSVVARRHSVVQTIAKDVSTKLLFDTSDARFENNPSKNGLSYNAGRFTNNGDPGVFDIKTFVQWDSNGAGLRNMYIKINGNTIKVIKQASENTVLYTNIFDTIKLNTGDYIEVFVMQTGVAVLNIGSGDTDLPIGFGVSFKAIRIV